MKPKNKLIEFLEEQIEVEKSIVESLDKALPDIRNPVVKGTLRGISLDSLKHAEMYRSAVNLLTGVSPALTQKQLDRQRELVQKHIKV